MSSSQQQTALITGATVGIGFSFAQLLASKGYNLILNARSVDALNDRASELRKAFGVEVEILSADLSTESEKVEEFIRTHQIDVLVNNAGFGLNQSFTASSVEDEQRVLDVLVRAPMRLSHAVIPQMKERKSGKIINIASVAGFIAGGHYSAAKAYINVLSESLATELAPFGVTVTSICPGFTHTEFHQRAGMKMNKLPNILWLDSEFLVRKGWSDVCKGRVISVPGWQYKVLRVVISLAPRSYVRSRSISIRSRQR